MRTGGRLTTGMTTASVRNGPAHAVERECRAGHGAEQDQRRDHDRTRPAGARRFDVPAAAPGDDDPRVRARSAAVRARATTKTEPRAATRAGPAGRQSPPSSSASGLALHGRGGFERRRAAPQGRNPPRARPGTPARRHRSVCGGRRGENGRESGSAGAARALGPMAAGIDTISWRSSMALTYPDRIRSSRSAPGAPAAARDRAGG